MAERSLVSVRVRGWRVAGFSSSFSLAERMGQKSSREAAEESLSVAAPPETEVLAEGTTRARDLVPPSPPVVVATAETAARRSSSGFSLRGKAKKGSRGTLGLKLRMSGGISGGGAATAAGSPGAEGDAKRRVDDLFDRYRAVAEDSEDVEDLELNEKDAFGPNGMAQLLADLGLAEDDILAFAVAYKLGASRASRVTRTEFANGLAGLKCESLPQLRALLPRLEGELLKTRRKDIFSYAFKISRAPNAKTLDLESARILLELFLPPDQFVHTRPFVEWLAGEGQGSYRSLNMDQFGNFYDFAHAGIAADLSNFDEDECWPCMIDEYVEWQRTRSSQRADGT